MSAKPETLSQELGEVEAILDVTRSEILPPEALGLMTEICLRQTENIILLGGTATEHLRLKEILQIEEFALADEVEETDSPDDLSDITRGQLDLQEKLASGWEKSTPAPEQIDARSPSPEEISIIRDRNEARISGNKRKQSEATRKLLELRAERADETKRRLAEQALLADEEYADDTRSLDEWLADEFPEDKYGLNGEPSDEELADLEDELDRELLDEVIEGPKRPNFRRIHASRSGATPSLIEVILYANMVDMDWQDTAFCKGANSDLFFPERGASTRAAKAMCRACSVRKECLEFAIASGQKSGIWGGFSERERRRIRRERQIAADNAAKKQ